MRATVFNHLFNIYFCFVIRDSSDYLCAMFMIIRTLKLFTAKKATTMIRFSSHARDQNLFLKLKEGYLLAKSAFVRLCAYLFLFCLFVCLFFNTNQPTTEVTVTEEF